jgi:mRNA-degrading endonuclease RelE of RelBE toxin-antitoxin system
LLYQIEITTDAQEDIKYFRAFEQRFIGEAIVRHLKRDAEVETRKRKKLRPNPLAPWELKVESFRVFYSVVEDQLVRVVAVGRKEHNDLYIRGRKVDL